MSVDIKDMVLDDAAVGRVALRVYQGADCGRGPPVLIYFRESGFGDAAPGECAMAECLAGTGAIVVVPDCAALGSAFPRPLEVGFSVFSWMARKRAGFGDRKSLLLVGGGEAGGNIAAAVSLKARDQFADELDGQVLVSPLLDPFMGTPSFRKAEAVGMRDCWADGWSHYLSGGVCHPYAAPSLCSRLSGIAPALLLSSQDDPLLDETIAYAERLKAAGVDVCRHVFPAGTGWPSIYGGKTGEAPSWHEGAGRQFASFIDHIGMAGTKLKSD
ncbi:acetyl esterase/lipase [Hoeflea marina]|uniref:Acetyl esterase/lipase n=1 Tax=Hoeflea marina TaxID=274592 RepID=A0A317PLE7_9HYPH|nr:alpha/beta hydrolase [Hoeflea marina]PWV99846.1 acetyl esterase/lipase [Hoeflea marina]